MLPASLALIAHLYTHPQQRDRAVGIWAGVSAVAVSCGPLLGGLLVNFFGWRSVFLINVPCGLLALILASFSIPETPAQKERSLDGGGQLLAILTCCSLTYGLIEWGHVEMLLVVGAFLLTLFAGAAFLAVEAHQTVEAHQMYPMLPLSLFRSWPVSATMLVGLLFQFSFYGILFVFSLFFQLVEKYPTTVVGITFLPQTASCCLCVLFGTKWLARRFYLQVALAIGMGTGAVGIIMVLIGSHINFALIALGEVLIGGGSAL